MTPAIKRPTLVCSAIVAAAVITGCSTSDEPATDSASASSSTIQASTASSPAAQSASHNDADIKFNQMMIPHHEQALAMAALVGERTDTPAVRELADRIENAQQPEIDEMAARLTAWGVPADDGGPHGGHAMAGMMTEDEMSALTAARGTAFDTLWLEGMIRHHEGAVAMADDELDRGIDARSRELAARIKAAQQAEIDEMNALLAK
ncbi:DUF305 domain-containing protein [Gordonia insulae]|uniref:DUF305 domain-containing protein n=1 Tax=Gordonia insulae TaxID=2420509 RepID=A0A3G8JMM9_9ACTN|nr:DUF305 domain-containing protein [Gordonia insulae]AZG46317.1 hypothetical protein D7316_02918 [Gordonia insulae]